MRALSLAAALLLGWVAAFAGAQGSGLSPKELQAALAAKPTGAAAESLATRVRQTFGAENLLRGAAPKVDGLLVAWAIEAPGATVVPAVAAQSGGFGFPLDRIGTTDVYAGVAALPEGTGMRWSYLIGDRKLGGGQLEVYSTHPDSLERPGVPRGKTTQMPAWKSKVFPDTTRDWWVYVPSQYSPDRPAGVMVWQDGAGPRAYVPTIMDNLIAGGDLPVIVNIFVNPGTRLRDGQPAGSNRSFEYDTLSDQYARFLLDEILPEVGKQYRLRTDAGSRAIAGSSSGGICAFTVAWERPDQFSRVLSWVGSFTNIASGPTLRAGGHNYPAIIRKTPRKPIRVFLQDGENDLDNVHGSWPLANQQMARALAFQGYDYRFAYGQGFHSGLHGRAILPDSLRWLWRDYKP